MTDPITPTTQERTPETKLPWQAPEIQRAEINLDTAILLPGSGADVGGHTLGA